MTVAQPQNYKLAISAWSPRRQTIKASNSQIALQGTDQADEGKYRRLTIKADKDLTPLAYTDVVKKAFYLWQRNLIARRLIEVMIDFSCGDEMKISIKHMKRGKDGDVELKEKHEGQLVWDDFYEDPQNDLEDDFAMIATDFLLNGELVMPANVNKANGKVWVGYLDPRYILPTTQNTSGVQTSGVKIVPGNVRKVDAIVMQYPNTTETVEFKVIRFNMDGDPKTNPNYGKLFGDVFFFQINKLPTQLRGYSQLMPSIDWADAFDQFLFGALDGFDARNDYFFDLLMEGANDKDIQAMKVSRPDRGTVNIHNERSKWEVVKADLAANDVTAAADLIKQFILGANALSEVWFGKGDTSNRSVAEIMSIPTKKMLQRIQKSLKRVLKFMARYVLQCAEEAGTIPKLREDEYYDVDISLYNLDQKELETGSQGFSQLVAALKVAVQSGWAEDETAVKVVNGYLTSIGIEIDTSMTAEKIKEVNDQLEKQRTAENTLNQAPPLEEFIKQQGGNPPPTSDPEKLRQIREKNKIGEYANK